MAVSVTGPGDVYAANGQRVGHVIELQAGFDFGREQCHMTVQLDRKGYDALMGMTDFVGIGSQDRSVEELEQQLERARATRKAKRKKDKRVKRHARERKRTRRLAIEALKEVALYSASEKARVAAAEKLLALD